MLQQIASYVDWNHVFVMVMVTMVAIHFVRYSWALIRSSSIMDGIRNSSVSLGMMSISFAILMHIQGADSGYGFLMKTFALVAGITLVIIGGLLKTLSGRRRAVE